MNRSPNRTRSSNLNNQDYNAHMQKSLQHSLSASKNDFAYGNMINSCEYSHLEGRKCSMVNNSYQKLSGASMSTCIDDTQGIIPTHRHKKTPSVPQSLQNSLKKKNKSICDRLDTTENLLKKINKKFDNIFKDGPKINVDISRVKKHKANTSRIGEKSGATTSRSKDKYNGKMKNLIKKIIMGRSDIHELTENSSSVRSQDRSNESTTFKATDDTKENPRNSVKSRYDKIDEESSYANSGSLNSSVNTDSVKMPKGRQAMTMNKEITLHRNSECLKQNLVNQSLQLSIQQKENSLQPSDKKSKDTTNPSSGILLFYDNILSKGKPTKTIHSARKSKKEGLRGTKHKYSDSMSSRTLSSVSGCQADVEILNNNEATKSFNIFSLHDSNVYKDSNREAKIHTCRNKIKNNLRRKMLKSPHDNGKFSYS